MKIVERILEYVLSCRGLNRRIANGDDHDFLTLDVAFEVNPADVRFLSSLGDVECSQRPANLLKQLEIVGPRSTAGHLHIPIC